MSTLYGDELSLLGQEASLSFALATARSAGSSVPGNIHMRLVDRYPDADALCSLPQEELGHRLLPELVTWRRDFLGQNLSLETVLRRWCGDENNSGGYPASERDRTRAAIGRAWAWLEGQGLLIEDPYHVPGNSFRIPSRRAIELATQPITKTRTKSSLGASFQALSPTDKKPDIFIFRPTYMGIGLDLKEFWRRARAWVQKQSD